MKSNCSPSVESRVDCETGAAGLSSGAVTAGAGEPPLASDGSTGNTGFNRILRALAAYGAAAALSLLILVWVMRLWKADLAVPFVYRGDTLLYEAWVKAVIENGWYLHNPCLGAPFAQDMSDFPMVQQSALLRIEAHRTCQSQLHLRLQCVLPAVLPPRYVDVAVRAAPFSLQLRDLAGRRSALHISALAFPLARGQHSHVRLLHDPAGGDASDLALRESAVPLPGRRASRGSPLERLERRNLGGAGDSAR